MAAPAKEVKTLAGKVIVRVNLLDNSQKTLLVEPTTTVQDVVRIMAEKVGLSNPADDCLNYSLHECKDGVTIERALPGSTEVVPIQESWADASASKFVFLIKLFTSTQMKSEDPKAVHMMYIQAVYNVISGIYPIELDDVATLAALQLQNKFGDHNPDTHKVGFLTNSLLEYIPNPWFKKRTPEDWEALLFEKHAAVSTADPMLDYIAFLSERDYYGCTLFGVKQLFDRKIPKTILLGVNHRGVLLLKPADMVASMEMVTLAVHPLSDIYRWAYKPGVNFYFEMKPDSEDEENPVYTFQTMEGQHIADMLTDYAMGLLREMGLNPDGSKRDPRDMGAQVDDDEDEVGEEVKDGEAEASGDAAADAPAADAEEAAAPEAGGEAEAEAGAEAAAEGDEDLPEGWIPVADEDSGAVYYYNNETGESSWEKPTA